ncbi:MAG: class II aldolase/adducin family protein [Armatimonadota bacterium]|nr:class II aldolase/adducin family protein [Armatimonadota bacterium]
MHWASMGLDDLRQQLCDLGRYLGERGLAWGTSGNISLRVDEHRFLISASGAWLGRLVPEQTALCSLHDARFEGAKPSVETPMHRAIYLHRPEAEVVVHVSPPYATLVACSTLDVPTDLNIENIFYVGRVARVPYIPPGTQQLADAVGEAVREHETIILSNHGFITFHIAVPDVLMRVESFEMSCRLLVLARMAGLELNHLPAELVEQLRSEASGYSSRLSPAG